MTGGIVRVELAPGVLDDFDRFFDHMVRFEVTDAPARIEEIVRAMDLLTYGPLIGRPVRGGKRELVIGRDGHGYVAVYLFMPGVDTVFVLALRSQRERGYKRRR